jgi:hypothetical protein
VSSFATQKRETHKKKKKKKKKKGKLQILVKHMQMICHYLHVIDNNSCRLKKTKGQ